MALRAPEKPSKDSKDRWRPGLMDAFKVGVLSSGRVPIDLESIFAVQSEKSSNFEQDMKSRKLDSHSPPHS